MHLACRSEAYTKCRESGMIVGEVKVKLMKIEQSAKKTGGGPACKICLNQTEEIVADTFNKEQITGIGRYDVLAGVEDDTESSKEEANSADVSGRQMPQFSETGSASGATTPANYMHPSQEQFADLLKSYMCKNESFYCNMIENNKLLVEAIFNGTTNICHNLSQINTSIFDVAMVVHDLVEVFQTTKNNLNENETLTSSNDYTNDESPSFDDKNSRVIYVDEKLQIIVPSNDKDPLDLSHSGVMECCEQELSLVKPSCALTNLTASKSFEQNSLESMHISSES